MIAEEQSFDEYYESKEPEFEEVVHEFVLYSFGPDFQDDALTLDSQARRADLIYWPVENGKKN